MGRALTLRGSLSRQLFVLVLGAALALSMPAALVNLWLSYREESARQEREAAAVISLFGPALERAVWTFDEEAVRHVLSGVRHFDALSSVVVQAPELTLSYEKPRLQPPEPGDMRRFELRSPDKTRVIGTLTLALDTQARKRVVWDGALRFVWIVGFELLLLATVIFELTERRLTKPVLALSRHVREMTSARLSEPAPLPAGQRENELHDLSRGVTRLQHALHAQMLHQEDLAEALKDREQRLRAMADSIPNQLWTTGADGLFEYVSQRALDYFGLDANVLLGGDFSLVAHADDFAEFQSKWAACRASGKPLHHDLRLRRADGVYRWHACMAVAQKDEAGAIVKWFGSSTDITDRKRSEEQLAQSQKMTAIGQLAGGIAHDFNNQLTAIFGYAELLEMQSKDQTAKSLAQGITLSATRSRDLIKNLLAFSRKGQYESRPVDVHQLIDETIAMLERSVDKRIVIERALGAEASVTAGDPTQLQNALLNLAINARDAMPDGGTLTFSTRVLPITRDGDGPAVLARGDYLVVSVSDTGHGMSEAVKSRLFEPFFTTKPIGKGTGMGLASVYGTVEGHGGAIDFETQPGLGTTFRLYLPLSAALPKAPVPSPRSAVEVRPLSILVVDDDAVVRDLLCTSLMQQGHRVLTADSGEAALATYRVEHARIDLVILDLIMPGMGGLRTFHALQKVRDDVRVLLSSGYSAPGDVQAILEKGEHGFLQKPFEQSSLRAAVAQVMGVG